MRPDLVIPRVVCEYVDVFPDELPRLPPYRDVDFGIELHPGTCSPFCIYTKTPQNNIATRALLFSYTHVTLDNLAC